MIILVFRKHFDEIVKGEVAVKLLNKVVNRETILYAFFGVLTSVLNIALFTVLVWFQMDYKAANFITLIITKLAAYICNKNFVFMSKTGSVQGLLSEFMRFVIARGATMVLDYVGLILLVELCSINKVLGKVLVTAGVIIINYFVGKSYVFKQAKN